MVPIYPVPISRTRTVVWTRDRQVRVWDVVQREHRQYFDRQPAVSYQRGTGGWAGAGHRAPGPPTCAASAPPSGVSWRHPPGPPGARHAPGTRHHHVGIAGNFARSPCRARRWGEGVEDSLWHGARRGPAGPGGPGRRSTCAAALPRRGDVRAGRHPALRCRFAWTWRASRDRIGRNFKHPRAESLNIFDQFLEKVRRRSWADA